MSILGLKLIHVSKSGLWTKSSWQPHECGLLVDKGFYWMGPHNVEIWQEMYFLYFINKFSATVVTMLLGTAWPCWLDKSTTVSNFHINSMGGNCSFRSMRETTICWPKHHVEDLSGSQLAFPDRSPSPYLRSFHHNDVIMGSMASQITSLAIVYSAVYSGTDQRKHQSSASLAFARGIHWSPHKWPVTRKMFPFDDVIMQECHICDHLLSGVPDYFGRNKISNGGDLSHYSSASLY